MIDSVIRRIQLDYLLFNRLSELSGIIGALLDLEYQIVSILEFVEMTLRDEIPDRVCIMRIDVDSDPTFCLNIADALKQHRCSASFYFRLETIDQAVMRELAGEGFEVGYHFEELATVAKRLGIKDAESLSKFMPLIREEFLKNLEHVSEILGHQPKTVASHGDFANRKLGVTNSVIIDDAVRGKGSLVAEAYDESIVSHIDANLIDTGPPHWWSPQHPLTAIKTIEGDQRRIRILIHPKHWRSSIYWNTKHNIARAYEGIKHRYF